MKAGVKFNITDYSKDDKNYLNKLCETQMIVTNNEETQSKCITKFHVNATISSESNLVPCNLNQKCAYNYTDNNVDDGYEEIKYEDCACGYNRDAKGYCPSAFNASNYLFIFFYFTFRYSSLG